MKEHEFSIRSEMHDININNIPMNRFLSHDKTKADLTDYLAAKTLQYNTTAHKRVIASSSLRQGIPATKTSFSRSTIMSHTPSRAHIPAFTTLCGHSMWGHSV